MDEKTWLEAQAYALWMFRGGNPYHGWHWLSKAKRDELVAEVVAELQINCAEWHTKDGGMTHMPTNKHHDPKALIAHLTSAAYTHFPPKDILALEEYFRHHEALRAEPGYVYLASPYSHPDTRVRYERFLAAEAATASMLQREMWVYSPIVHCHELTQRWKLPTDAGYWGQYNRAMLRSATTLVVLNIPGWKASVGVAAEVAYAEELGLPVRNFMQEGA